jgi:hypothetical protein
LAVSGEEPSFVPSVIGLDPDDITTKVSLAVGAGNHNIGPDRRS